MLITETSGTINVVHLIMHDPEIVNQLLKNKVLESMNVSVILMNSITVFLYDVYACQVQN